MEPFGRQAASLTAKWNLLVVKRPHELTKLRVTSDIEVSMFHFQDRHGREVDCVLETVFVIGERPLPFGDRLIALPISRLWGGAEPPQSR